MRGVSVRLDLNEIASPDRPRTVNMLFTKAISASISRFTGPAFSQPARRDTERGEDGNKALQRLL